jgi:hypothetical protein
MIGLEKHSKELFVLLITVLSTAILEVQPHILCREILKVKRRFWRKNAKK